MTIIPLSTAIYANRLAVPLPRYAQIVEYAEPAFFGVNHPDNKLYACREIWSHDQRIAVYRALQNAQSKVEAVAEYPLMPTWIGPERHPLGNPQILNVGKLIQMGRKKLVSHPNVPNASIIDPAIFIHAVTTTDVNEIHVYHPGTHVEIYPSDIVIVGGVATITVPLVRMVAIAYENTPPDGLDMADYATWAENLVDIEEEYLDPTLAPVEFVSLDCSINCACPTETWVDGCAYVQNNEMSILQVGTTIGYTCLTSATHFVDLYYQAGETAMAPQAEDIIVRLAHALMPSEPCGCDYLKARWRGDQLVPEVLTAERENCPWGLAQGSWTAYTYAQSIKQHRMGVL
jgi:hypothetical protein